MLGLDDPLIALAALLCLLSTAACVAYSWLNWNRGDQAVRLDDIQWAKEEDRRED
jgi:hypothetical protein